MPTIRKLLALFEREEYPRLIALVLAMIVTGLLQTAGIASIMPFLAVVSNPEVITDSPYIARAYLTFGFGSTDRFLVALGALFVAVMVASNAAALLTSWATIRIQWRAQVRLGNRLLDRYLRAPYSYHLNQNSARLTKTLLGEVNAVVNGVFLPLAHVLARGISALFVVGLLIWVDPPLAVLVSLAIGGFYAVAYFRVRATQQRLGREASLARKERQQIANEAFGGIKEIKVLGRERFFLKRFLEPSERLGRANSTNALVSVFPKFVLETLAYGGIVLVIIYLLGSRETLDQIFPLLAVYAFGANRLMPSVQEIFSGLMQVRFGEAGLDELLADLRGTDGSRGIVETVSPVEPREVTTGTEPIRIDRSVRFRDVTFSYPNTKGPSVSGITLEIPANKTTAFVGATGAGKTTLVDLLLGLFEPTSGEILVDDTKLDETSLEGWRRQIGYVPQSIFLSDASIARNIAFGIPDEMIDVDAVRVAARAAHLEPFVYTLPEGFDTLVGERGIRLSGGQRQRIGIARALYHQPRVLVLDEATSALDNVTEDVVMQAIRDLGRHRTIVMIAHRLSTVRECDRIYVMEGGCLAAEGTYDDLIESSRAFREMARVKGAIGMSPVRS